MKSRYKLRGAGQPLRMGMESYEMAGASGEAVESGYRTKGRAVPVLQRSEKSQGAERPERRVQVFADWDATRSAPRYYTNEQMRRIEEATAKRDAPLGTPVPLDD